MSACTLLEYSSCAARGREGADEGRFWEGWLGFRARVGGQVLGGLVRVKG